MDEYPSCCSKVSQIHVSASQVNSWVDLGFQLFDNSQKALGIY
jgi:hypothetical protein